MSLFICTRHVAIKLNMAPDTEHSGQTSTITTITQDSEFNQELSFKDIHFNRFEVGFVCCALMSKSKQIFASDYEPPV